MGKCISWYLLTSHKLQMKLFESLQLVQGQNRTEEHDSLRIYFISYFLQPKHKALKKTVHPILFIHLQEVLI